MSHLVQVSLIYPPPPLIWIFRLTLAYIVNPKCGPTRVQSCSKTFKKKKRHTGSNTLNHSFFFFFAPSSESNSWRAFDWPTKPSMVFVEKRFHPIRGFNNNSKRKKYNEKSVDMEQRLTEGEPIPDWPRP